MIMKKILIFTEKLMTVIFFMIYAGTPLDPLLTNGFATEDADGSIYKSLLYTLTYIVSISLICLRWRKGIYALTKGKLTWVLIGVCALSIFWSCDMKISTRRVFGLIGTTTFGTYLASRYTLNEQIKLCAIMFIISAFMCIAFSLLLPNYGIQSDIVGGAWRGIYINKNILGQRFLLGGMIFLFLALESQKKHWVSWIGYTISFVLILLSKSTTSLGNFIFITIAFQVYRFLRWKYEIMIPIFLLIATLSVSFSIWAVKGDVLLTTVGKDTTLTGRTNLWPAVWDMILKKPWLGYGYGAFWQGLNGESANVLRVVGWDVNHAHNGFLDIMLSIGMLGLFIFAMGFFMNLWRSIYLTHLNNNSTSMWLLIYLTFIVPSNVTETTLMNQNSIEWVLYVSTVLSSQLDINTNILIQRSEKIIF